MKKIPLLLKPLWLAIMTAAISSALPAGAQSVWNATNGVSADINWSDANNWLPNSAAPSVGTNVLFADNGNVGDANTINNIVDTSLTIASLQYGQTNGFHNTLINSGVTLTIMSSGGTNMLVAGTETDNFGTQAETNTISGLGGSLVVNNTNASSVIIVRQASFIAGAHESTLDMSGLGTFTASVGLVHVGVEEEANTNFVIQRPLGIWVLAKTNTITASGAAPAFVIGEGHDNGGNGIVQLGVTNAIFADSIEVGYSKSRTLTGSFPLTGSFLQFNPAISNTVPTPALYLRGNNASRVGILSVGDNSVVSGSVLTTGTINLTGGTVDALVNTCYLGRSETTNGTGTAAGTLTFSPGIFDVNTMELGFVSSTFSVGNATGTVNVNGSATLRVNTSLRLGENPGATAIGKGILNINSGTVLANSILSGSGGANTTIKLNHGMLVISNSAGSASSPIGTFIATNNSTIQLGVAANTTNLIVQTLIADITGATTNTLNISSVPSISTYPAQFAVIAYTNLNAFGFQLGSLPATSPALQGYLSNNVANSTIDLVITNGPTSTGLPIPLNLSQVGNVLTFSWVNTSSSFRLQSQTNALNVGLYTNWIDYPGGGSSPVSITNNPANPSVFFRLISP